MSECPTCGAPINLAPDGDPRYTPTALSIPQHKSGCVLRKDHSGECDTPAPRTHADTPVGGLDVERLRDAMYDANSRCSGIPGECCAPPTHADATAIAAEYARLAATTSSADTKPRPYDLIGEDK